MRFTPTFLLFFIFVLATSFTQALPVDRSKWPQSKVYDLTKNGKFPDPIGVGPQLHRRAPSIKVDPSKAYKMGKNGKYPDPIGVGPQLQRREPRKKWGRNVYKEGDFGRMGPGPEVKSHASAKDIDRILERKKHNPIS